MNFLSVELPSSSTHKHNIKKHKILLKCSLFHNFAANQLWCRHSQHFLCFFLLTCCMLQFLAPWFLGFTEKSQRSSVDATHPSTSSEPEAAPGNVWNAAPDPVCWPATLNLESRKKKLFFLMIWSSLQALLISRCALHPRLRGATAVKTLQHLHHPDSCGMEVIVASLHQRDGSHCRIPPSEGWKSGYMQSLMSGSLKLERWLQIPDSKHSETDLDNNSITIYVAK